MVILSASDLRKYYGEFCALGGVSFQINEGEFVSTIGANGAGKTTLINVLTGLLTPNTGKVVYKGKEITGIGPEKLSKLGVAQSFQLVNIFPNFTVLEFLMVAVVSRLGKGTNFYSSLLGDQKVTSEALEVARLALLQPGNDKLNMHLLLGNLGMLLIHQQLEQSETYLRQGLAMALETRSVNYHFILLGFAFLANARGEPVRAVRMLAAAAGLLKADGRVIDTGDRPDYEENLASLRQQLEAKAFDMAWTEGSAMTKIQASGYALPSDPA